MRTLKDYVAESVESAIEGDGTCSWGHTTKAKAIEGCTTDGHTHRYVVDRFGYGKTSLDTDNGYSHWHLITDGVVQTEGNHTHELGKEEGKCNSINNISVDGQLGVVGV